MLTALQSDTREDLQTLLREYGSALEGAGARGFHRSIPYWEPAYRDSAIVADATLGEPEHDLSGYIDGRRRHGAAALDRNPRAAQEPGHRLQHHRGRLRARGGEPRARPSASCRTRCAPRCPRSPRSTSRSRRCARFAADLRPGVQSSEETLDVALPFVRELRGLVSEAELRGLAADLRPTVPDARAR